MPDFHGALLRVNVAPQDLDLGVNVPMSIGDQFRTHAPESLGDVTIPANWFAGSENVRELFGPELTPF